MTQFRQSKWFLLGVLALIWGSSFILMKKGLLSFSPLQVASLRIVLTAIIILAAGFYSLKQISRKQWPWVILTGFIGTFFPATFFAFAIDEIDSAIASILNSMVPLNTLIVGLTVFNLLCTRRQFLGVIIGLLGTVILIVSGAQLNPDQNYLYAGLVILATLCYAFNVNIIKRYLQDVPAIAIATGNFAGIIVPGLIMLALSGFFKTETLNSSLFWESLGYIFLLAAFGTALAKVLFNKLIQISTPVFASSVTYLITVVALFWGLLDGEKFSVQQGLATILIFFGVYLSNRKK
ncbi:MAG: EamA family transporter [Bacteroidia bacterium]|nr:EamA family transporter [Bacteroidia bacterium]NNF83032.1 EamA family transporter [Flavobacteriaceae bacterium]NNL79356.1 EamA family transporter [Flavobacteriaceae bacterium]